MRTQTRVLTSVAASLAVSALITCIVYFVIRDMDNELARGRIYEEIMSKTYALNLMTARFRSQRDSSHIRQIQEIQGSLKNLLGALTYLDAREESLVRQIKMSSRELGYSLEKLISSHLGLGVGMETERYSVLVSQLSMKTQFISDDTQRLIDISQSRIAAAQGKAGISILALIVVLVLINGAISFISGRSIARMQERLQKQRKWLQVTLASIGDGVIATDTESKIAFLNPVAATLTGWLIEEALGRPVQDLFRIINEKTREPAEDIVRRVLREGGNLALANHTALIARDGREIPIEDSAAPIKDDTGEIIGVVLVFHDVTEKRRDREALREGEERLSLAVQGAGMGTWDVDMLTGRAVWSRTHFEILGYPPNENGEATDEMWRSRVHPDDLEGVIRAIETARATGSVYAPEHRIIRADNGDVRWLSVFGRFLQNDAGEPVRFVGIFFDNTERKRAEEDLRQSRQDLDRAQEVAQIGSWRLDVRRNVLTWSDENHRIFGVPKGTPLTYETFLMMVHPDDRQYVDRRWKAGLSGELYDFHHRIVVGGKVKWVREKAYLETDDSGELQGGFGITQDITERKKFEEALRALSQFPEENPNPVLRCTPDGVTVYVNAPARHWLATLGWQVGGPLPASVRAAVAEARSKDHAIETEIINPAGRTFSVFAVQPLGEDYINLYGIDLTERKQAEQELRESEERLRASLGEKEVLLKEIHHRVKNNMQVISSLVALQADGLQDGATRAVLQDVTHRVRSMALVHEKLYQSADLARVEFAEYARSLLNYLWRAYGTAASGIRLTLDLEPVSLPVNEAVPCGLILNELVSNALKHAFRDRGHTEAAVTVSLRGDGEGQVRLSVRDNGTGLPAGFDWSQASSLGLRLVHMLAGQLHAAVEVSSTGGTEFKISFEGTKEL
jgi:PAS domain S-box-containing protein